MALKPRPAAHITPGELKLEELGARDQNAHPVGTEIDEQSRIALYAEHGAQAIFVVSHQVAQFVRLDRALRDLDVEGTSWQVSPGRGARWFH